MHTFTFHYIGDEESESWTVTAQTEGIADAYDKLIDELTALTGLDAEGFQASDLIGNLLQAVSQPGEVIKRRDFSTPEENYNLVYVAS